MDELQLHELMALEALRMQSAYKDMQFYWNALENPKHEAWKDPELDPVELVDWLVDAQDTYFASRDKLAKYLYLVLKDTDLYEPERNVAVDPVEGIRLKFTGKATLIAGLEDYGPMQFHLDDLDLVMRLVRITLDHGGTDMAVDSYENEERPILESLLK